MGAWIPDLRLQPEVFNRLRTHGLAYWTAAVWVGIARTIDNQILSVALPYLRPI